MQKPVFALVDGNAFYASCQTAFRPDLRQQPVIVLSNNDGCVVARSAGARILGIPMGVPMFRVRDAIHRHRITVFSANYELYKDMSARMMSAIASLTPRIETYSIDECFADLSGIAEPAALGHHIRQRVRQWTCINTCVGIGHSKVQAKLANHLAKKQADWHGVCDLSSLPSTRLDSLLHSIRAGEIWGIGKNLSTRLQSMGIHTALQLRDADLRAIRQHFGVVVERICRELAGYSCLALDDIREPNRQILRSRSFGQLTTDKTVLQAAISAHVSSAVSALREQGTLASVLHVFIQTNRFREQDRQYCGSQSATLAAPSSDTLLFNRLAMQLLDSVFLPSYLYKKAGVVLSGIETRQRLQADLFAQADNKGRQQLMQAMDALNRRFGPGTVQPATTLLSREWHMHRQFLSPCYTTRLDELPEVR